MRNLGHHLEKWPVRRNLCSDRTQSVFFPFISLACIATTILLAVWQPSQNFSFGGSTPIDTPDMLSAQQPDACISSLRRSEQEQKGCSDPSVPRFWGEHDWLVSQLLNPVFGRHDCLQGIRSASRPLRILNCQLNI